MAAPTTIDEAILQAILQPKTVSENGRTITARDLKELLDARDRETTAVNKSHFGMRFIQLVPPGTY